VKWGAAAEVAKFDAAVNWFRKRTPVSPATWSYLNADAKRKAFKVAGIAQLDLVAEVQAAVARAVEDGTSFETFKRAIETKLIAAWAGSVANPAARLDTIFRNGVQSAYSAGRYRQTTEPSVKKFRPYFRLDTIADHRQSPICRALTSPPIVLPQDDPFWASHVPPLHHRCRSGIRALRTSEAEKLGITEKAPDVEPGKGFGGRPDESEWQPDLTKYPLSLVNEYKAKPKPPKKPRKP